MDTTDQSSHATATDPTTLAFPVDAEHNALRFSMLIIFVLLFIITYVVTNLFLVGNGLNILALLVGLGVTFGLGQQIEKSLKKRWPSGRTVQVDNNTIAFTAKGKVVREIDPKQQVNALTWRFTIKRRSRFPKGWYMIACSLEQDGNHLPVYTFMSPDEFTELYSAHLFTELIGKKDGKSTNLDRDYRLAGQQRRLHTAESQRWMYGAEMSASSFKAFIEHLQIHFGQWMPQSQ